MFNIILDFFFLELTYNWQGKFACTAQLIQKSTQSALQGHKYHIKCN